MTLSEGDPISDEIYSNVIAAFYNATNEVLCVGALIKPNYVMTIYSCVGRLMPLNDIGVLTGSRYLKNNRTLTKLRSISRLQGCSEYYLIYVSSST